MREELIDIHSHILPAIDDGAKNIEKTLEMLQIASDNGIKKIVATPHFYRGYYENKYIDICKLVEEVNAKVKEKQINVEIFPGQEVFLDTHTLGLFKEGIIQGINGTRYMLIELPMDTMPKNALDIIYELRVLGIVPIIAHPERYVYIMEKPSLINNFIDENCLFQINSGSIQGIFGKSVQKTSEILLSHSVCSFIASDAHSTKTRVPKIEEALERTGNLNSTLKVSLIENMGKLLSDEQILSTAEKVKEKKSIFSFFKNK
ncbi:exopolysaccharide biosynthesis protein [Clostridiaceae bacterium UIB06]|nr:exopolysaccharide biosynthesis protein [Clostridiaceae bacterium UIB06]